MKLCGFDSRHAMSYSSRLRRDLVFSITIAFLLEGALVIKAFFAQGELEGEHAWLKISQMPGIVIAERLFRYTSPALAIGFNFVVQAALYTSMVLTGICLFRMLGKQPPDGAASRG